ncbi:hypothetical protein Cni_G24870 [Canna indica]|uniref:ARGOS-like protein n=1 Tax=Canna indica TaxID=4628 RepID=A0AAQ3KZQ3_9LILI|nr:hypothetical protein Cni_G24870 [Canna indica]
MDRIRARKSLAAGRSPRMELKSSHSQGNRSRGSRSSYFTVQSLLVLVCLTASLLVLPLVLPPLPPPPLLLLLLPICILVLLVVLAFKPSDVRDIAASYL